MYGSARVLAPAKVNLSLRILGKREDGYHEVESIMAAISSYDEVEIDTYALSRREVQCQTSGPEKVPGGASNLAAQAADRVLDFLDHACGVRIRLLKRIPAGAGLGGGSSDAAAVLRALPALLGADIEPDDLHRLALGLGADVPYFLYCAPAVARGVGEILEPISDLPAAPLVVVVPSARVNTAWAYREALPGLTSTPPDPTLARFPLRGEGLERVMFNTFEAGVSSHIPHIGRLSRELRSAGATATVMSGSGSAVVGLFDSDGAASQALPKFSGEDFAAAVTTLREAPAVTPVVKSDGR